MAVARRGGRCAGLLLLLASAALQMAATALPAQDVPDEPSMPEAPEQFRVGLTLSRFDWREEAGADAVEDGSIYGAEVETLVHPFVSFRFGVAFGQPEVRSWRSTTSSTPRTGSPPSEGWTAGCWESSGGSEDPKGRKSRTATLP
jgi:hypothetical protein